ncbi:MAG: CD1247 N-terminal domain-containing protein [Clostridia bacterium]
MESLAKRIAYLRGLSDGLEVGENSKEGRIASELVEILDETIAEMKTLHLRVEELETYVEAVDEDLNNLELYVYDEDDLYEFVDIDDGDYIILDENDADLYDLDDSEDASVYERRNTIEPINPT